MTDLEEPVRHPIHLRAYYRTSMNPISQCGAKGECIGAERFTEVTCKSCKRTRYYRELVEEAT